MGSVASDPGANGEFLRRRFRRNLFTGQLEEVFDDPRADFKEVNARSRAKDAHLVGGRTGDSAWGHGDKLVRALSIQPEQVTPERIERENEQARRHGTGAWFDKDGGCHVVGRHSRSREMRRQNRQDNDAGYGDYAGR